MHVIRQQVALFNQAFLLPSQPSQHLTEMSAQLPINQLLAAKQLFFCNLTESDLRSDSPVV